MKKQYRLVVIGLLLVILTSGAIWLLGIHRASAVGKAEGKVDGFVYKVETIGDVALVNVELNVDDPQAVQRYRDANYRHAVELMRRGQVQTIDVQITFARPVPPSIVREMAAQTDLVIRDYLLAGYSPEGRKITSIYLGPITPDVPDVVELSFPNGESAGTLAGVMLLRGSLHTSETSLGRWLSDPVVYMVDTMGMEARRLVAERHAAVVGERTIEVTLHSPFWQFDW